MKRPLLVNISTDSVYCYTLDRVVNTPYQRLETTLPGIIHDIVKSYIPTCIIVLNGPGGFTALRIGALTASMIASEYEIPLYDISKITLFNYFVEKKLLPEYGIIHIGQRNNVRWYDFSLENEPVSDNASVVTVQTIQEKIGTNRYFVDQIDTHRVFEYVDKNLRVTLHTDIVGIYLEGSVLSTSSDRVYRSWESIFDTVPVKKSITPNYMIDPTLG